MVEISIEGLSNSEKLLIARRRSNFTQEAMAAIYGVSRNVYGEMERGQREVKDYREGNVEPLKDHEKLLIARRRAELKQEDIAEEIGVTRYWLNRMELGHVPLCKEFVMFWEDYYARGQ
ncbi:MAG: hypothetical protein Tp138OMZ00d2C19078261_36 [Prokaryotic dsDNA virus sp.]|jgi:transcriptional regulator with XRE-family HTH domain|nr:MAG: hypothetical protein Tp138OMZ00d2C19078261_36 [Prokaryotic dsDNA virus sp.]|tara:strand:- start:25806 stop:26162 length:357 start_codon:yes stop_codon:yes gene_type:complete